MLYNHPTKSKTTADKSQSELFPIVVIGASAGGFEGIKKIVEGLPPDFRAAVIIVWHTGAEVQGVMPGVLNKINNINAAYAFDEEEIVSNRIYIAPPDLHLLIEDGTLRLTHGPKENFFRPAIDPLFRSAAYEYGDRVIGIILSGGLDDGTSGLWTIKNNGGTTIVQHPDDAEVSSMPESAIRSVSIDYCVPVAEMADILNKLSKDSSYSTISFKDEKTSFEVRSASGDKEAARKSFALGQLSPFTCPECHGVLSRITEGKHAHYRCHTGHAFSADTLLDSLAHRIENHLYTALAAMDESILLLNHMGDHLAEINKSQMAASYFLKANETERKADTLRRIIKDYAKVDNTKIKPDLQI